MRIDREKELDAAKGPAPGLPAFKVFVSSPGDVGEERLIAKRVIDRIRDELAPHVTVEPIFWEHEPLVATADFQSQIALPSEADIVVTILWSRLGTRLPKHITRTDGSRYDSGTEFEFEDALEGRKRRGDRPDLLVYRKLAEPSVSLRDEQALLDRLAQKKSLDAFIERWFQDREEGTLIAAFHPFDHSAQLEDLLDVHLRKLIARHLPEAATGPKVRAKATWTHASPFRGLEAFEHEHAPIFFGRTKAVGEVLDALRRQAQAGRAFVLVLGMSGCGKSSLVRAGVLPMLTQPGVIEGVGLWRRAVMRPSDGTGDVFDALALALLPEEALPELGADGTTATELAASLRDGPKVAAALIKGALAQVASEHARAEKLERQRAARLALVIDQLEELFTTDRVTVEHRIGFVALLSGLARSGRVYVLATLRGDFHHRCAEIPELVALKAGAGLYDLLPPTPAEIGQMVRRPARAAGLCFEAHPETGQPLDDVLRDAGALSPESLPLLQFALEELYRERSDAGMLTHAAYEALDGVEGALARRAEAVYRGLGPDVQAALPEVFRGLVTVGLGEDDTVTRRTAPVAEVARTPERLAFVHAFVAARLLVADRPTGDGTEENGSIVRVAHEALLRRWPRLVAWIDEDKELLRIHTRIAEAATRWEARGRRRDLLLQEGKPLEEAELLRGAGGFELTRSEEAFVRASKARAARTRRVKRAAVGVLALLTVLALVGATVALQQRREARRQSEEAHRQSLEAQRQRKKAEESGARVETQLQEIRRLADVKRLQDLEAEAETLWPAHPDKVAGMVAWLERARALASRLPLHQKRLASIRAEASPRAEIATLEARVSERRSWTFENETLAWEHRVLEGLVEGTERLTDPDPKLGALASVEERLAFARTVEQRTITGEHARWREAIASIADPGACPLYEGYRLTPQIGLVPIGRDPASGLWEFWHLQTGARPARDADQKLVLAGETGLVFVLIPGGTFSMGAVRPDKAKEGEPNLDPEAEENESDGDGRLVRVTLKPFFLSKYEMTQGQWLRSTGENPSLYRPGDALGGKAVTLQHPVEQVSWEDVTRVAGRLGLVLPTEAQWEYAARAGTSTVWWTGDAVSSLQGAENVADAFCKANGGAPSWSYNEELDDGYAAHAPVGSFRANRFGLHDVGGNVAEWCRDRFGDYDVAARPGDGLREPKRGSNRVDRGGTWSNSAGLVRAAVRSRDTPSLRDSSLGFRPARCITR